MPINTLEPMVRLTNTRISKKIILDTPRTVKEEHPITKIAAQNVFKARREVEKILDKQDSRLIVYTGPCSIHNYESAIKFAYELKKISDKVKDKILVVMRTYFEKPRTGFDWPGFIRDPYMDGTLKINEGYKKARKLLLELAELGIPVITEILDEKVSPLYIDDLTTVDTIGARNVHSQTHRNSTSGWSMPVGFKNDIDGDISTAVNAVSHARHSNLFVGFDIDLNGCFIESEGNPYGHIILRGGNGTPNYTSNKIEEATSLLEEAKLPKVIIVDCSHGNSGKDYKKQPEVFRNLLSQRISGNTNIVGLMLEAHIKEGKQKFSYQKDDPTKLDPDQSPTDGCISIEKNNELLLEAYEKL
jgi:3-deoxy-7-phosphoheptulonate synthase